VVPEVVEGGLQLVASLFRQVGVSREEIEQILEEFRREAYARLSGLAEPAGEAGARAPG
jgi:hypothetical protein